MRFLCHTWLVDCLVAVLNLKGEPLTLMIKSVQKVNFQFKNLAKAFAEEYLHYLSVPCVVC